MLPFNSQLMGFYPPNTSLCRCPIGDYHFTAAHQRQRSEFTADENSIRIGLKQVEGMEASFLESLWERKRISSALAQDLSNLHH